MAKREHLRIIKQGTDVWNAWREKHPQMKPDLSGADLRYADLRGVNLKGVYLGNAMLGGANLSRAILTNAILMDANFNSAILTNTILTNAILTHANLINADLINANFIKANLSIADVSHADLSHANLSRAKLNGTKFTNTNLTSTNLSKAEMYQTIFHDLDLRQVKGLEAIKHLGPSGITTSTLERSQGDIPEVFLRGAGLSDTFIDYTRSLVQSPIQYYTCFISYSSKDQEFAERVYADLQSKNVRCWFAPEDLKIGDKFRTNINEAIRLHDKLLLVLSKHSVNSLWVEKEVETAFEKEHKQNKLVLFPVKVDDTVMQTEQAWAADIRRIRHIGDFCHWKEHNRYQKAFARLLRDLKAETSQPEE